MLKIETEKIVVRGEKKRKVISISGLIPREVLPEEYTRRRPYLVAPYSDPNIAYVSCPPFGRESGPYKDYYLRPGIVFPEETWECIIATIQAAGERLHLLRQEEKKLKETWQGIETFVI